MNLNRNECPICRSNDFKEEFAVTSNADGPITGYKIIQCRNCTARLTNPVPSQSNLSQQYNQGIYSKSGGRIRWVVDFIFSSLYANRLREIKNHKLLEHNVLLDIGCGKGRFLAHASNLGWQVEGTETAPIQVSAAQKRYNIKVSQGEVWEAGFPDDLFTVITAWHVFEHLSDPHQVFSEIGRILAPKGLLVCEIPNFDSWQAKIGVNNWFQLDPPRHLTHFTLASLKHLLSKHQMEIIYTSTFSPELGYFGMLQTLLNVFQTEPNWLFQWLKRTKQVKFIKLIYQLSLAFILLPPAFLLETWATFFKKGGVLRVIAVKE